MGVYRFAECRDTSSNATYALRSNLIATRHIMKLYIAQATCSLAVQAVFNELELAPQLVHFDVFGKTTSDQSDFADVNDLLYVPALELDGETEPLTETITIASYIADLYPESGLIPKHGTLERVRMDQLLTFVATEIAQKHIPLMRKLMKPEGIAFQSNKLLSTYGKLDARLADGRSYLTGEQFTVADAYVWATMWHERSGVNLDHLKNLEAYIERIEARASVKKALRDEADLVAAHKERLAA
ncbi:putative glutathionine S-transferase (plasmid) [Caballeronia insecticola]|uniref:Putative glutathionine S-transferase n=2 Tax=Caballeronia insecticola TaxID=758793 RepID=R4WT14_9BURK|nr:putative glutathionine S-transferase [Caballeronia insecticola]